MSEGNNSPKPLGNGPLYYQDPSVDLSFPRWMRIEFDREPPLRQKLQKLLEDTTIPAGTLELLQKIEETQIKERRSLLLPRELTR